MNRNIHLIALILISLVISGCASWFENYGKPANLSSQRKNVTIDTLIKNWKSYDIYYNGLGVKLPLGVLFDPKDNRTKMIGDQWQKVGDQKTLMEVTRWIYPNTLHHPRLIELLGTDNRFLGYLYYSWGPVILKKMDESTYYMFHLENPEERRGEL
jgi:hypothetical protein